MAEWVGRSSMTRQARENCGVVGIFSLDGQNVIPMIFDALRALQHRGQEAWGIAIPNKPPFKRTGLVSELKDVTKNHNARVLLHMFAIYQSNNGIQHV